MIETIYLDMDGVLCDFEGRVESLSGKKFEELNEEQVKKITKLPEFFEGMEPNYLAEELVTSCFKVAKSVKILTSVGKHNPGRVVREKIQWLELHFPELSTDSFYYVHSSKDKAYYAEEDVLLIDDREKSCLPFKKAGGRVLQYEPNLDNIEIVRNL